jgi:nitroreductase
MMLVAWNEGIGSCPNGMPDRDGVARVLGLEEDERPVIVLTFGYPAGARDPQRRSPEEWVAGADRKAFEEVVRRL